METAAASTVKKQRPSLGLLPFFLLFALLALLQSLFPLLVFGPGFYGALSMRLTGWGLLLELSAPLLFGGVLLAALLMLFARRKVSSAEVSNPLRVHKPGDAVFLGLTAVCAALAVYPGNHIGYGLTGAPYIAGLALSFLWQAAVATGFAVLPVYYRG